MTLGAESEAGGMSVRYRVGVLLVGGVALNAVALARGGLPAEAAAGALVAALFTPPVVVLAVLLMSRPSPR